MDLPGMKYRIQSLSGFTDGNVYPRAIRRLEVIEVDGDTKNRLLQSDPEGFVVLEMVVPPSVRETPAQKGK